MPPTNRPKPKLLIACPAQCSFHPEAIGEEKAEILRVLREAGAGVNVFTRRATEVLGRPTNTTSVGRHLKHYREAMDAPPVPGPGEKVGDLAILEAIIAQGYRNSQSWKPSIKDTLDAMRLKIQLTGSSAFEDMLAAMDAALDLADGAIPDENPEALAEADERPVVEPVLSDD